MKKFISTLLVLLVVLSVNVSFAAAAGTSITDVLGRTVTFDAVPERIISLAPSNTEILFALGLGAKVVGVDAFSDYPAEALAIENKVGDYNGPNIELIISLDPDVVFASSFIQEDAIAKLEEVGIKVVAVEATVYKDIIPAIELVATICGADAAPVVEPMIQKTNEIVELLKDAPKVSVYYAMSFGEFGDWTASTNSFIDDMINMAGGTNVIVSEVPWPQVNLETILAAKPEVVLVSSDMQYSEIPFEKTEGYKDLDAAKNGKVYMLDANQASRTSPRIVLALEQIARLLHPELMPAVVVAN